MKTMKNRSTVFNMSNCCVLGCQTPSQQNFKICLLGWTIPESVNKKNIKQNNKQCLCTLFLCVGICANTVYYQKASIKRPNKQCKPHEEQKL